MEKNKAVEVIREYYPFADKELNEAVETFIPDVKESLDEKVRKAIIKHFESEKRKENIVRYYGVDLEDIFAWLKKKEEKKPVNMVANLKEYLANTPKEQIQKDWDELKHWNNVGPTVEEFLYEKQNPTDKVESKFKVGDYIKFRGDIYEITNITTTSGGNNYYDVSAVSFLDPEERVTGLGPAAEENMQKFIPKFKVGDMVIHKNGSIPYTIKNIKHGWYNVKEAPFGGIRFISEDEWNLAEKPGDDWIEDYWEHNKVNNPDSYDKGDEIQFDHDGFVRFCNKYFYKE